jgi:hypothetical protein
MKSLLGRFLDSLDEWLGVKPKTPNFEELTKVELENYGRDIGIELDRRKTKANMIKDLQEFRGE